MTGDCRACHAVSVVIRGRGWCRACYDRWAYYGKPETPPPARFRRDAEGIMEDYLFLTSLGIIHSRTLAERMGVTQRTVFRYRKRAKEVTGAAVGC